MVRPRLAVPILLASAACSTLGHGSTLESSVIVAANGRVKTTVTAEGPMTVVLQGLGPGAVTFDVRAPQGSVMAHGVLTTESSASCHTNGGEIRIEFAAGVEGGTVAYVLHTENGGTVTTIQL